VGHIFWYTLDAPGYDLGELRALQDWYIKYGLQTVKGVSELLRSVDFKNNIK